MVLAACRGAPHPSRVESATHHKGRLGNPVPTGRGGGREGRAERDRRPGASGAGPGSAELGRSPARAPGARAAPRCPAVAEDRLPGSASCSVGRGLQGRLRGAWDFPVPGPGVQGQQPRRVTPRCVL